ncbi:hypothetical protein ACIQUG_21690 [Ensifer sp. NPDC090286]|uniref:hypothetical protein n=1 Tax=Ensifer sp. NPDC090286 TaxID=3363991 RepID=UPI003839DC38
MAKELPVRADHHDTEADAVAPSASASLTPIAQLAVLRHRARTLEQEIDQMLAEALISNAETGGGDAVKSMVDEKRIKLVGLQSDLANLERRLDRETGSIR